jgi:hypothetical protein
MLRKTITFEDLDGNPLTEDFYFNLTAAEIAEMEMGKEGGFMDYLQRIVAAQDAVAIVSTFKDILKSSYGVRSRDNKRFIKSDEVWLDFMQSDAYSVLFLELITDADASAEFIQAIVPKDLAGKIKIQPPPEPLRPRAPMDHQPKRVVTRRIEDVPLPGMSEEDELEARLAEIRASRSE